MTQPLCCVCHEPIEPDESNFGACEDCLDDALSDPEAFLERMLLDDGSKEVRESVFASPSVPDSGR
jgi:hypothetical protein